jgi:hypothetical protein
MNSRQKKILVIGGALVALMLLFPPWVYHDERESVDRPVGYHFILAAPPIEEARKLFIYEIKDLSVIRVHVDSFRLSTQLLFTIPATLGLIAILRTERSLFTRTLGGLMIGVSLLVLAFIVWLVVSFPSPFSRWDLIFR